MRNTVKFEVLRNFTYQWRWFFLFGFFVACCTIWYAVLHEERGDVLTVAFLDVGQGDAIFIESPTGVQVLIDGGSGNAVLRELGKVMPFYDRSIDVVIATHPDADHIGGLIPVLKRYEVEYILRPGVKNDTPATESLLALIAIERHGVSFYKEVLARREHVLELGSGAYLRILFPDRDASAMEPNTASIVAQLVYGEHEFLLTGDSPEQVEKYLVSLDGKNLRSDVLKLGHHGSKTSTGDSLLGFAAPEYAIISAGKDNSYGHPHKIVLEKLERFKIPALSTAKSGTIIFKSNGVTLQIKEAPLF